MPAGKCIQTQHRASAVSSTVQGWVCLVMESSRKAFTCWVRRVKDRVGWWLCILFWRESFMIWLDPMTVSIQILLPVQRMQYRQLPLKQPRPPSRHQSFQLQRCRGWEPSRAMPGYSVVKLELKYFALFWRLSQSRCCLLGYWKPKGINAGLVRT